MPDTDEMLATRLNLMREERKRIYEVEGDGVDVLLAQAADRLSSLEEEKRVRETALLEIRGFAAARTNEAPGFGLIVRTIDTALSAGVGR